MSPTSSPKKFLYIKQPDDYSCGPTCLEMILYYYEVDHTSEEIRNLCGTAPSIGTENQKMVETVEKMGLKPVTKLNATIPDIIEARENGYWPIVNYFNPISQVGHFAVVTQIDNNDIILADPKNGEGYRLSQEEFSKLWHNNDRTIHGWMMYVVLPPDKNKWENNCKSTPLALS